MLLATEKIQLYADNRGLVKSEKYENRKKRGIDENQQQQIPFDEHEPKTKKDEHDELKCKRKPNREYFTTSGITF